MLCLSQHDAGGNAQLLCKCPHFIKVSTTGEAPLVGLWNKEMGGVVVSLLFGGAVLIAKEEASRVVEKDMRDLVEEREPELVVAVPQV